MDVLERRMFRKNDGDIDVEVVYNYIKEAKRIFPIQKIPKSMENKLIEYIKLLRTIRGINRQNIREFRTLVRLICGISAIRLKTEVDESDLEYLQKHLVNLMIPFFEYDKIRELKAKQIDMNEVYQNTIKLLSEVREIIPIHEHISLIRHFLEDHYFPYPDSQIRDPVIAAKINEYMPSETGLNKNQKYRTLLENKENIAFVDRIGYIIGKKDNKKHFFKKKWGYQVILDDLKEIYHDNENSPCEKDSLIQVLEFKTDFDKDIIDQALNFHIQNKNLIKTKENYLKLDGVGGEIEKGDI
jgi:phage anti-repressor protein